MVVQLLIMTSGAPVIIPYADNMNTCGADPQEVQSSKDKVVAQLRSVGHRVHEEEEDAQAWCRPWASSWMVSAAR